MVDLNESRDDVPERRTETHHVHYDPSADAKASDLLVSAVADIADEDPLELDPLYETVDPDTIDEFVDFDSHSDVGGHLSFVFEGYYMRVHASDLLEIEPAA